MTIEEIYNSLTPKQQKTAAFIGIRQFLCDRQFFNRSTDIDEIAAYFDRSLKW